MKRKLTKDENGVLLSDGEMIICPLMTDPRGYVGCWSRCAFYCAFYSEVNENQETSVYCNLNGSRLADNEILIGEFPEDNPAQEAIADSK